MQVEFLVNGGVSVLLSPETEAEAALLKQLMKQDNTLTEIRTSVVVLNKTFRSGMLIEKRNPREVTRDLNAPSNPEPTDESQEETV